MTGWSELDAEDCGRIIAALEHFAADHPDLDEVDVLLNLAERIATDAVLIADEPTGE